LDYESRCGRAPQFIVGARNDPAKENGTMDDFAKGGTREAPVKLTERQKEILRLAASGLLAKQCAHALGITVRTVEAHRVQAILLLGARNITHAVAIAIRKGIIPLVAGATLGLFCLSGPLKGVMDNYRGVERMPSLDYRCISEPLHLWDHDRRYCTHDIHKP
jgi:DNA-binding CsgD family transcriptional regulator